MQVTQNPHERLGFLVLFSSSTLRWFLSFSLHIFIAPNFTCDQSVHINKMGAFFYMADIAIFL